MVYGVFSKIRHKVSERVLQGLALNTKDKTSASFLLYRLFGGLVVLNLIRLAPYIFTATAFLSSGLALALPIWARGVSLGVRQRSRGFIAHLVPKGSPMVLAPFMVLIESVSLVIRPFTLAVRLMANMLAGHLILSLVSAPLRRSLLLS